LKRKITSSTINLTILAGKLLIKAYANLRHKGMGAGFFSRRPFRSLLRLLVASLVM
jgi:hypothetical protein